METETFEREEGRYKGRRWEEAEMTFFEGKIEYKDGGVFEGKTVDYFHYIGKGSWYYFDTLFTGELEKSIFKGRKTKNNGTDLVGTWNGDDIISAQGKRVYGLDVYEGEFLGIVSGKGKITFQNGDVYEGSWEYFDGNGDGKPRDGNGKFCFYEGLVRCEGVWENFVGLGKVLSGLSEEEDLVYTGNLVYEGTFGVDGRPINGKGSLAFLNLKLGQRNVLSGTWENETGSGVVECKDNSNQVYKYFGTFKIDFDNNCIKIITGEGSYLDGENLLIGKWEDGNRKGQVEVDDV